MRELSAELRQLEDDWSLARIFELPKNANIIVAGAYRGLGMEYLARRFPNSHIVGFEPQAWAAIDAIERLEPYDNTFVRSYAIGVETTLASLGNFHTDGASLLKRSHPDQQPISIIEFDVALMNEAIKHVDLFVVNMEGYEYELIPYLRDIDWLSKIDRLAIQWHLFDPPYDFSHMNAEIAALIDDGYNLVVDHRPTWTYFVRPE